MSSLEPLPHVYPFRFVERSLSVTGPCTGTVRGVVTAGAAYSVSRLPLILCEMLAQSVLLVEGGDVGIGRSGFLAGISGFEVLMLPAPGDLLTIDVRLAGRFGPVVKFEGEIRNDRGEKVASGALTVRQGIAEEAPTTASAG